jgi:hypothetical protein
VRPRGQNKDATANHFGPVDALVSSVNAGRAKPYFVEPRNDETVGERARGSGNRSDTAGDEESEFSVLWTGVPTAACHRLMTGYGPATDGENSLVGAGGQARGDT